MRALAPSSRRCLHGTKGGSCCLALERASWLPVKLLVLLALASCFAFPGEFLLQASKRLAPHSEGKPGARSVGRITACGYPPALQGIGGYRLWRYSPYGTFERASCLLLKLLVVLALASCFAFPGELLLQASKRLALPLGGHARSPIRRANDRLRLSAGSPGHRRIPPVAVFALRDVRAGFMFAAQAACRACLGLLFRLSRRAPSASVQKTRPATRRACQEPDP